MTHDRWFGVEVRHLAALAAVAAEGSFRGAADSLGYVQSAVSQQIAHLERLVGVQLVTRFRGSKEVRLTSAGEALLSHAEEILAKLHAARADLAVHADPARDRTLKVGVFHDVAAGLLPGVLRRVANTAPDLRVVLVEATDDSALFERVERGEVDVAFGDLPLAPGPFASRLVLCDRSVLLAQTGSEWTQRSDDLTLEELAELPLIALDGHRSTIALESSFTAHGLRPRFARRCDSMATLQAYVAAGMGVAIVPRLGFETHDAGTELIDLGELLPPRRLALYWHAERQHGPALDSFRAIAMEAAHDVSERRFARRAEAAAAAPAAPVALVA